MATKRTIEENQKILSKLQEELGLYGLFGTQVFQAEENQLGVRLNRFMGTENKPITAIEMVGNEIHYPYDIERMTNITKNEVIEKMAQLTAEKEYVADKEIRFNQQTNQITGDIQGIDIGDDVEYSHDKWVKEFDLSILSDQELAALTYNQLNQLKSSAEEVKSYYSSRDEEESDYFTWKADFEAGSFSFSELSKELLNRNVLAPTIPFITGRDESELLELDKMLQSLQQECRDVVKENKAFQAPEAPEAPEAKFEVSKAQVENAIAQAQEGFKAEVLAQSAENIYEASDKITYVEGALGELEITFKDFNYQEYENPEYIQGKQFAAMIDLQEAEGINPSLLQSAAEQSYFKTDGPYIYGEDLNDFVDDYIANYLELEPYINQQENNLNQFKNYREAMEVAYPDVIGDDGFLEPDEEGLDVLKYVDENKLSQIFTESNTLDEFKTNTKQAFKEEEKKLQKEWQEQQDQYWQEQFEEQEKTDEIYAKYTVDGDIWNIKPEWFADSKNKEIDSDLITKTLEERTPEQIATWNAQGGAPALLDAYWAGLDDKQRGELIQYVRYYNEANYNTDIFFDHDTGATDDLESHNIEFVEEEKFEVLGLTDEVKREYQTLWTMLNDSSVDQPYRLANISKLELEAHFNKLQNLLNDEQDQLEVSSQKLQVELGREFDEVWIYDPKDTEEGVPWTKPWHAGNVGDRIKELQNMISEAGSDGMIELNEEKSISKDSLEKELEVMVDYTKSGDKAVLPEKTFINPKPDDFQKANVKVFGLRQKENLGEFIKEYHTQHPTPTHSNGYKPTQKIGR